MTDYKVRVGIDVGGTNTKAVAINDTNYEIIGEGIVPTTHGGEYGVSQGVVDAFQKCLTDNNIDPKDVVFIAHSTTQATNALLEGDVAKVGVIGIATGGVVGWLSRFQANISDIELDSSGKRKIVSLYRYINEKNISDAVINETIDDLLSEGCEVIAVSRTFGVDNNILEQRVKELGKEKGIEVTSASDISKLYGLTRRTRTAVINSSILPKMINTANSTESAVKEAGIEAPLMIMRGDGGVMDIEEMRKRPVLTMLSGPAASTVGALMYLKVSNGIFVEVGGTSTDIGVIKNGRPMVDYAVVGGQRTMVSSMDVHVSGVAGGSMVRAEKGKINHVGPRSCHIASLPYLSYSPLEELTNLKVINVQPQEGDPEDYVALENDKGKRFAITTTDAATALGIIKEGDYSYGNKEATLRGFEVFGEYIGMSAEEAATAVLDNAADTCINVIEELANKYNVERSQISLVGGGGGAKVLVPFIAKKMDLPHSLADKAEVISSIGVALALVQDVVERVIPDPTQEDIMQIRSEAQDAAIQSGASAETVEVQIEIDTRTSKVRAIATGSTEASTKDLATRVDEEEAKEIVAESMQTSASDVHLIAKNDHFFVFGCEKNNQQEIRVIDTKGVIKRQRADGTAETTTPGGARSVAHRYWDDLAVFKSDIKLYPDIYMCIGGQVVDYEGLTDANQLSLLMDTELSVRNPTEQVIIVGARNDL